MITIRKSPTADSRTCDYSKVTKEQLLDSSLIHINDVRQGLEFFKTYINQASNTHDFDKISQIDSFHSDFLTGFRNTTWWEQHKIISRHHLLDEHGIKNDVNLIDVLEFITDCVMAGLARSGTVYPLNISSLVLKKAFENTVELLKNNVQIKKELISSERAEKASDKIAEEIALLSGLMIGPETRKKMSKIIQEVVIEPLETRIIPLEKQNK